MALNTLLHGVQFSPGKDRQITDIGRASPTLHELWGDEDFSQATVATGFATLSAYERPLDTRTFRVRPYPKEWYDAETDEFYIAIPSTKELYFVASIERFSPKRWRINLVEYTFYSGWEFRDGLPALQPDGTPVG